MGLTTTQRGYGWRHQQERARVKAQMEANGGAICWRCHTLIAPTDKWDLGHRDDARDEYAGPEHRRCNRGNVVHRGDRHKPGAKSGKPLRLAPALRMFNHPCDENGKFCRDGVYTNIAWSPYPEEWDNAPCEDFEIAKNLTFLDVDGRRLTPIAVPS